MAIDEAPPFWWRENAWQAILLSPISLIYGRIAGKRMDTEPSASVPVPVICVGNFITGGAGKTPTVQMISRYLRSIGMRPGVLTRGHGGAITSPTVVRKDRHNSHDVGDEALLHAAHAITVVSADRPRGAELLVEQGCDIILMDDGFQNPSLAKDFCLIVVDAKRGLGNGFSLPAGPMRVPLRNQLLHADAVLVIGEGERGIKVIRNCAKSALPVFLAHTKPISISGLAGRKVVAFAGISDPSKVFDTLKTAGVEVVRGIAFGDHHVFTDEECNELLRTAQEKGALLVTTAKDAARLRGRGEAQERLLEESEVVNIILETEDPNAMKRIVEETREAFDERRLSASAPSSIAPGGPQSPAQA